MNYFKKNGKQLKKTIDSIAERNEIISLVDYNAVKKVEKINSLSFDTNNPINNFRTIVKANVIKQIEIAKKLIINITLLISKKSLTFFKHTYKTNHFRNNSRKYKFSNVWVAVSFAGFVLVAFVLVATPWQVKPKIQDKYSIYSSRPLTLQNIKYQIYTRDSRAQRINAIFREYKCPLEGLGEVFVYEADKNNIPWWLTAAMSFQESGCGKKTPEPSGLESYNAWGWAVYGDNVQSFDNWVRGVETVSEYMSNRFFSKGITDLCDVMKVYTPPSNGSWCKGVQYFGQEIQDFKTPDVVVDDTAQAK